MEPDQPPDVVRRIADRRHQLAIYRAAYAETYGRHLDPATNEAEDVVLQRLLGTHETPATGHRVTIDAPTQLAGTTGLLLSADDGWAQVKVLPSGAIYQVRTDDVRLTP